MTDTPYLGENLIFLISQPRAGSTLLQTILAGHQQIHTAAEPWVMLHPVYALRGQGIETEYDARSARLALDDFISYAVGDETVYLAALRAFAETLYARALAGTGKTLFLDKTPRYYYIIPDLYQLFPRAHFIFLLRNPLAVLYSILTTWIRNNSWPRLANNRDDLRLAPQRMLNGIAQLGDSAVVMHYEDLARDPEAAVKTLCERLALPFNAGMLRYGDRPPLKGTLGDHAGIGQHIKPSADSLQKWRQLALSRQYRHFALAYLDDLGPEVVEKMGYSFDELQSAFAQQPPNDHMPVVPWRIVIRPKKTWTWRDRLIVERGLAVQKGGVLRGHALWVGRTVMKLLMRRSP